MKKACHSFICITFPLVFFIACNTNSTNSLSSTDNLMKGVKSRVSTEIEVNMHFGELQYGDTLYVEHTYFSEEGKEQVNEIYGKDGIEQRSESLWSDNTLTKTTQHYRKSYYGGSPVASYTSKFSEDYDEFGRTIHSLHISDEMPSLEYYYEYDNDGHIIQSKTIYFGEIQNDTTICDYSYEFDDENRILVEHQREINGDEIIERPIYYSYAPDGSVTKTEETWHTEITTLDSKGNLIKEEFHNEDSIYKNRNEYEYDSKGRPVKITNYHDEIPYEVILIQYELY